VTVKSVALETQLSVREVESLVDTVVATLRGTVDGVELSTNPIDRLDGVADIAVVGHRAALVNGWAVQVYVFDLGETRGVELVAVGDGGLPRLWRGLRNSTSLSVSTARMDVLIQELRTRDPQLRLIA
jgi:hypothetical protein